MDTCFRDTEESLIGYRKNTGNPLTVMTRIDAAEGETDCDDVDQTTHIEASGDGTQFYASFDSRLVASARRRSSSSTPRTSRTTSACIPTAASCSPR